MSRNEPIGGGARRFSARVRHTTLRMQRMLVRRERSRGAAENKRQRKSDLESVQHGLTPFVDALHASNIGTKAEIAMRRFE
jgi:hypothetical protein